MLRWSGLAPRIYSIPIRFSLTRTRNAMHAMLWQCQLDPLASSLSPSDLLRLSFGFGQSESQLDLPSDV